MQGIVVPANSLATVELKTLDGSLEGYQSVADGLIQVVEAGGIVFIVNEEGKLQGMPINNRATSYLYALAPEWRGWDVLAGPVLIMGNGDGEFTSVPQAVIEALGLP